jgi:hypothetical protein
MRVEGGINAGAGTCTPDPCQAIPPPSANATVRVRLRQRRGDIAAGATAIAADFIQGNRQLRAHPLRLRVRSDATVRLKHRTGQRGRRDRCRSGLRRPRGAATREAVSLPAGRDERLRRPCPGGPRAADSPPLAHPSRSGTIPPRRAAHGSSSAWAGPKGTPTPNDPPWILWPILDSPIRFGG